MKHNENSPGRSIQLRRPCDHHYNHGAGIEGAAWSRTCGIETTATSSLELCTQFYLRRHLLEQSPPLVPGDRTGHRRNSLGKPAFAVLVVALSFYHGLDG